MNLVRKILFVVPYPIDKAPSQRLKFEQYYSYFQKAGINVEYSSFINEEMWEVVYTKGNYFKKVFYTLKGYLIRIKLLKSISNYDIVYVHLWCTPFGPPFFEWLITKFSKKVVYDIDDLVFLKNIKHENTILSYLKGKNKPLFMMKNADHVIACTPYLEKIAKKYNDNVTDISSTINTDIYLPTNKYENNHKLVIGWSGSHSTSRYLTLLKDVFLELRNSICFKLLVIGDINFTMEGIEVETIPWNKDTEVIELQKIDIGVYPLPIDEEWILGKSGLKALQYMALGIPTIATNIGCNDRVIENGIDGYLVNNHNEWVSIILKLCRSTSLRREVGIMARKKVETQFSVDANANIYLKILNGLVA